MTHPLLLIHGLIGHLKTPEILAGLAPGRILAPDLLGYGAHRDAPLDGLTLARQADHLAAQVRAQTKGPVHIAGHSVGGAIAVIFATSYPDLTASVTSIEGNFTLKDAFWSSKLAAMPLEEVEAVLARQRADVAGWLAESGVPPTERTLATGREWLGHQPAATVRAQARAVVEATGAPAYLDAVADLIESDLPFYLLAGERSERGWDAPSWVRSRAASSTVLPGTGHLMMLEDPEGFGAALRRSL